MAPGRTFRRAALLDTNHGPLRFGDRCLIMGVLNVTPDSFSDGGRFLEPAAAVAHAHRMVAEGADLIDIGGESTRPGSRPVPAEEQMRRVLPAIEEMRRRGITLPISIDTRNALVAEAAISAGADLVNDVSAARHDPHMPSLLARLGIPCVLMHMQGTPETMQKSPSYADVVEEVLRFFEARIAALSADGVPPDRVVVDPGIGFGKTLEHNLSLLRAVPRFAARWPLLIGGSRKRFIGELLNQPDPSGRLMGTAAVTAFCALAGADMVRVHDVGEMRQIVEVCRQLRGASALPA